jgi:hypothetical protein
MVNDCLRPRVLRPMVANWNGTAWTSESPILPPIGGHYAENGVLSGVSCFSSTSCYAVGVENLKQLGNGNVPYVFGNGKASVTEVQSAWGKAPNGAALYGVSCANETTCIAIGEDARGSIIERLTPSYWEIDAPSNASGGIAAGLTNKYGTTAPVPDGNAGSGTANKAVSFKVTGLQASTAYHYRLVAKNKAGTIYGQDVMLTTSP